MDNIVRMEDLPEFIAETMERINAGVLLARQRGMYPELPSEVQFDLTLVKSFQVLEVKSFDTSTGTDTSTDVGINKAESTSQDKDSRSEQSQSSEQGNSASSSTTYT
jgi:hypothetical protein